MFGHSGSKSSKESHIINILLITAVPSNESMQLSHGIAALLQLFEGNVYEYKCKPYAGFNSNADSHHQSSSADRQITINLFTATTYTH